MRDYLVFQLYGPLSAWGEIAVGETRPAGFVPSKSAILGLIAAALGLRRPDTTGDEQRRSQWEQAHQTLADGYGMAVKISIPGLPLSDYHTAQVPSSGSGRNKKYSATRRDELVWMSRHDLNTILSRRDYRQDAFAGIALWARQEAPYSLTTLRDRLQEPEFILYLGRKSCPLALPLHPQILAANDIETALSDCSLSGSLAEIFASQEATRTWVTRKLDESHPLFCWDSDAETKLSPERQVTRRDLPASRRRWQFSVREEYQGHGSRGSPT
jgi:CRISPR system Cascade subunit CasD